MSDIRDTLLRLANEKNPHLWRELTFSNVEMGLPKPLFKGKVSTDTTITTTAETIFTVELAGGGGGSGGSADFSESRVSRRKKSGNGGDGALVSEEVIVGPGKTVRFVIGKGGRGGEEESNGFDGGVTTMLVDDEVVLEALGGGGGGKGNDSLADVIDGENAEPLGGAEGAEGVFPVTVPADKPYLDPTGYGIPGNDGQDGWVTIDESVEGSNDRNTAVTLTGIKNRGYFNQTDVYYKRHDLNALFEGEEKPEFRDRDMSVDNILERLNNRYGLYVELDDFESFDFGEFTDDDLETSRDIELKVKDTSYGWIGTVTIELRYGNPLIESVVIVQLLPILEHPDTVDELEGRRSGLVSTWAFDFTAWKDDLNIDPDTGEWANFARVQEIGEKAGLGSWYNNRVVDLPTSQVPDANPMFERVMVQNTARGSVMGPIYFHYDLNW